WAIRTGITEDRLPRGSRTPATATPSGLLQSSSSSLSKGKAGVTSSATRLAIEGGAPVRTAVLPYARQVLDDDDIARVVAVLKSDWLTTGPAVEEFEQAFAVTVGARHAVAIANGTAALHAAAAAAGLGPNHEVIVPAMTFAASANCARYVGANVRFADVRTDTLCLDVGATERGLTARTRAIVAVDFAGQPCDWDDLRNLANRR